MKFAIAKEHKNFFQKQGMIEFEGFISSDQLALFNQAIDQALESRMDIPAERLRLQSSENLFLQGRDLWRANESLRKLVCQPRLAEIASELIEKKPLRLGYDQLFPARYQEKFSPSPQQRTYAQFLAQTTNLETISSLQGVACGLMLCLGAAGNTVRESEPALEGLDIFPSSPGQAIFFQPQAMANLEFLYAHPGHRFYLIVYAQASAYYQLQPQDPHTHALKHLGYVFNDKLNDKLNPIVYR
ncbi:hypothetical protein [Candidatus Protochlamydia phocaeensis]|uniref:hypothetical protein n=1 Tax=Candidatus Protochlamydia phocaeensis TaxID=1414722 RepID=UPI000838F616|nr:hypothetical protein [Candidatus Protochlamydia phocaeensis]